MNADKPRRADATLRVSGDQLDPSAVTALLGLDPTFAVRKGEAFERGMKNREYVGRTGVWGFAMSRLVDGACLQDYLDALEAVLSSDPRRIEGLRRLVTEQGYRADVFCYWYGPSGSEPLIPGRFRELVKGFGGEVDLDFYIDDDHEARSAAE